MKYSILFVFFIVIGASGCGRQGNVNPSMLPLLYKFQEEGRARGAHVDKDIDIEFGDASGKPGICQRRTLKLPKVVIDERYWNTLSLEMKEVLLYHELGHCILDREHKDGITTVDGSGDVLVSLMSSNLGCTPFFGKFKRYYLDELFSGR